MLVSEGDVRHWNNDNKYKLVNTLKEGFGIILILIPNNLMSKHVISCKVSNESCQHVISCKASYESCQPI